MSSLVDYTVLGLLIEKPSYGYEVSERLERRFGDLVEGSSQSNIYAVLKRLEREAMIERTGIEVASGTEGRPRIYFRATGNGAGLFRGWLAERMRDDQGRSELLRRLVALGVRRVDAMLEVIDRYEQECMEAQRAVKPEQEGSSPTADRETELIKDLLAEERRRTLAAQVGWADYARSRVRAYGSDAG